MREAARKIPFSSAQAAARYVELENFVDALSQIIRGETLQVDFLKATTTEMEARRDDVRELLLAGKDAFKEVYANFLEHLDDEEIERLRNRTPLGMFELSTTECEALVADEAAKIAQARLKARLEKFWFEKTGTRTPVEWSQVHKTPILCLVADEEFEDAKRAFETLNKTNPEESEINEAFEYLQRADFFRFLNDEERRRDALKRRNVDVEYLPVDRDGIVSLDALKRTLATSRKDDVNVNLATIMFANNEIGAIQPIAEIGALLRTFDVPFHTDATQAVGHIPLNVRELNVDFLTASAHKFNGPKGTGFLFCRRGVAILPTLEGGEQERGLRAGTENVAGAVATAYALAENVATLAETTVKTRRITAEIVERLQTALPQGAFTVVGDESRRLPGMLNIVFKDVSGEAIVQILDLKGVCASTGAACSSGKTEPSPTALALGFSPEAAKSSVRLSFDRDNSPSDAAAVAKALAFAYRKILTVRR